MARPPSPETALVLSPSLPPLRARMAWSHLCAPEDLTVNLFRREFTCREVPASSRILVSADSRYVLWCNGQRLGRGPLKGTTRHYHAETYELAPWLRPGRNVLAVEVRWFGRSAPTSEVHGPTPGLLVQGFTEDTFDTPGKWRTWCDDSVTPGWDDPYALAHKWLGPMDRIDAARRPADWNTLALDDADWKGAVTVGEAPTVNDWGEAPQHQIEPRDVPALRESLRDFSQTLQDRQPVSLPLTVAAGQAAEFWLDAGALTTSHPILEFSGGAGREIRVIYAEALGTWSESETGRVWHKRDRRDDVTTKEPHGYRDVVILPGGDFTFEPFHWRTFWFIKLEVLAGTEPLTLQSVQHRFTTYPQDFSATFSCAAPDIDRLWSTSLHTLRLCAHETYEDCPYFEQLNYTGDSRLQAMCSHYLANDPRLGKRCLRLFRDSLGANGLTASRVPARGRQDIPAFSLHWILMLGDHWRWVGEPDLSFVRESLLCVDAILHNFRECLTPSRLVGRVDHWNWIDWVPDWPKGVSPVASAGTGCTYLTALYAMALATAAELHLAVGVPDDAARWIALNRELQQALQSTWSETHGWFREGPGREADPVTQHAQVMVLLAGAATREQKQRIGARLVEDSSLVQMSLFQRFYLAKALARVSRYDRFFPTVLEPWRVMMANGLSTWQEHADPVRSDCHAWSSWMIIAFFSDILGARPAAPGWKAIHIEPQLSATDSAAGTFTMPTGPLHISWTITDDLHAELTIDAPTGVPVTVTLPGPVEHHFAMGGHIELRGRRHAL